MNPFDLELSSTCSGTALVTRYPPSSHRWCLGALSGCLVIAVTLGSTLRQQTDRVIPAVSEAGAPAVTTPLANPLALRALVPQVQPRELVGTDAFAEIISKLRPQVDENLSGFFHAVHLFGDDIRVPIFGGTPCKLLELLQAPVSNLEVAPEVLVRTRYGLRFHEVFPWALTADHSRSEAHPGQGLSILAMRGVPLATPVRNSTSDQFRVHDVLQDLTANFTLEGEIYWDAIALTLYIPPARLWSDKFGEEFTFDDLSAELMARSPEESPCGGTHALIALTILLRADLESPVLSRAIRSRLREYLQRVVRTLEQGMLPDGGWTLDWDHPQSATPESTLAQDEIYVLTATGHHLEWLILLPTDLQPTDDVLNRSAERCLRILRLHVDDDNWVRDHYCPATHAARSIGLLAGLPVVDSGKPR